ncbi:MAG: DUF2007 domain-containing protein [Bryobacteraceae bacterium]|nr:DUF2007 domain-containing protein [Bryobacteraceae bacterium]
MYCPECGVEYRPGFSKCSDCLVSLVDKRPLRTHEWSTVLETSNSLLLESAAGLLEEAGIRFSLWWENGLDGDNHGEAGIARSCRLEVRPDREVEARTLIENLGDDAIAATSEATPPTSPDPELELVVVSEGDDPLLLASAKSALNSAEIPFSVEGEELGPRMLPTTPILHPPYRIRVGADRFEEAQDILNQLESALTGGASFVEDQESPS